MLLACCGDSPELVEKDKKLDAQIADAEQQLAQVRKDLEGDVRDVGAEYDQAREQLVKLKSESSRLESELIDLRDDKESLESNFTRYRNSHPIN